MTSEGDDHIVLTKTAYEHLVAVVGKMLEQGKKAGQQADSSLDNSSKHSMDSRELGKLRATE